MIGHQTRLSAITADSCPTTRDGHRDNDALDRFPPSSRLAAETWVMLVETDNLNLLKGAVWEAWRIADGRSDDDPSWQSFRGVQDRDRLDKWGN